MRQVSNCLAARRRHRPGGVRRRAHSCSTPPAFEAEYIHGDIGWEFWCKEGDALPARTLELLRSTDCAFFGAITSKPAAEATARTGAGAAGQGSHLPQPHRAHAPTARPVHLPAALHGASRGNPLNYRENIDLVVFRENTEGMYIGVEFPARARGVLPASRRWSASRRTPPSPSAASRRKGSRRIVRRGFRIRREARTAQGDRGPQGQRAARHLRRVSRGGPGSGGATIRSIEFDTANVDAMCMWLLKNPQNYDVIVTTNLFGDILSDLCAQLVGGMGFGYSGNIGDHYAVFEPTHGSAPKYAGLNKVNPLAAILAAKMMLEWLGEGGKAAQHRAGGCRRGGAGRSADLRYGRHGDNHADGRSGRRGAGPGPVRRTEMANHVRVLATLNIVFGALGVLGALIVLAIFGGIAALVGSGVGNTGDLPPEAAAPVVGVVGAGICVFILVLSLPGIITGIGLLRYCEWARVVGIVLSAISLPAVPFGTALGVYGLWVLLNGETVRLFANARAMPVR